MVDLALLQSVSYIAGALGVCVAASYYVMNLRSTRARTIVEKLKSYKEAGAEGIIIGFRPFLNQGGTKLFIEEGLPRLK